MTAQTTFTTVHYFEDIPCPPCVSNGDGAYPDAGLVLFGNTLFATTYDAGLWGYGTVFAVNTDGTGFTTIHNFNGLDGGNPRANLILSADTLYGTTFWGNTVFAVRTDGTGFTNLHIFASDTTGAYPDGAKPWGGLMLLDGTLFGTTIGGGQWGLGTVFKLNTDGTGFSVVHSFGGSDGTSPACTLISSGNTLYGTTGRGGNLNTGTVFAVNFDGSGFRTIHSFSGTDGGGPLGNLVLSSNTLYGTTTVGGSSDGGTLFAVNIDGTGFRTIHSFSGTDGANPWAGLILSGNTLYGATVAGGSSNNGTVFAVDIDGTTFTIIHSFNGNDGSHPKGSLVLSGNNLYGTTEEGGILISYTPNKGTVFSVSISPKLAITTSGPNVIMTWPTNYAGFDYTGYTLQSTTNPASPFWTTNLPGPVIINGQYAVTNPISATQQFFRLSQ